MKIDKYYWQQYNVDGNYTAYGDIFASNYLNIRDITYDINIFHFRERKYRTFIYGNNAYSNAYNLDAYHVFGFIVDNNKFYFSSGIDHRNANLGSGYNSQYSSIRRCYLYSSTTNKGFFNNSGEGIDIIENLNTKHRVPIIIMNELYLKKQEKRKLENKQ